MDYLNIFLALAGAHLLAVASPGPDFAVVTKNTVNYGRPIGKMTAIGVGVAILMHVTLALLGFSAIFKEDGNKFAQLLFYVLGAGFLIYLGVKSLQAKPPELTTEQAERPTISVQTAFLQGFLTNALNIKAMLFFLFLFTSIVPTDTPTTVKAFFGAWLSITTAVWFTFIAQIFGTGKVRAFFQQFGVWFDRIMGVILIALAVLLLFKANLF